MFKLSYLLQIACLSMVTLMLVAAGPAVPAQQVSDKSAGSNAGRISSEDSLKLIPSPREITLEGEEIELPRELAIYAADEELEPLAEIIDYEYGMLTGGKATLAQDSVRAQVYLNIDSTLDNQEYLLEAGEAISITGGDYQSVAMGSVTLMQMIQNHKGVPVIPAGVISDRPDSEYRGLLVDPARNWHDISVLKQIIKLCRWYKINYLQLHLTDNESFTFPTESHPELPTPGLHYSKEELRELDEFARKNGVVLVPELDVPGHTGQFVRQMPGLFGIADMEKNSITINMGKEEVYRALDAIAEELAEVFRTSPFIHIGGDETNLDYLDRDPQVQHYMEEHHLENTEELYRHFLVRMNGIVKKHGKQTIVWEGFSKEGEVEIPRDIIVMAWETMYQLPQDLLADDYTLINVSWKPLYVVNERKWSPEYIYNWNIYRWENWLPKAPSYEPIQLEEHDSVIGASMASWAQPQHIELPTLRRRLAAMSERVWNVTIKPSKNFELFETALSRTDSMLQQILSPVEIRAEGLLYPELEEGRYNEQFWFDDSLVVILSADSNQVIRYTLDGSLPDTTSPAYTEPVTLNQTRTFRAKAFDTAGQPAGYDRRIRYEFHPLKVSTNGNLKVPLSDLWKKVRSWEAEFTDSVVVVLETERKGGTIRYTLDGSEPAPTSFRYSDKLVLRGSAIVTAQLFENSEPTGEPWRQQFIRIR